MTRIWSFRAMAPGHGSADADPVTTATHSPFSYVYDPSGTELRRALIRPDCDVVWVDPAARAPLSTERAEVLLAGVAGLTLLAGVARVALS